MCFISLPKVIVSKRRTYEFANRTMIGQLNHDTGFLHKSLGIVFNIISGINMSCKSEC